jgi:hypothetical protein
MWFKYPETGIHTNNVEGIHMLLKKDTLRQFGRSADIDIYKGSVRYLELAQWRVNRGLEAATYKEPKNLFRSLLLATRKMALAGGN